MGSSIAYYNERDPFAAAWLTELIKEGVIADGVVDDRDIQDVRADELAGYTQCHFFAGIGGWSYALRLAGWPDDCPVWTGSCPCQPFSNAGKRRGVSDDRHLWPVFFSLIRQCRPTVVFGEQVASKAGRDWLASVQSDLESLGYAFGAAGLCAYAVKAPHERLRSYWCTHPAGDGCQRIQRSAQTQIQKNGTSKTLDAWHGTSNPFEHWSQLLAGTCIRRVVDGVSSNLDIRPALRGYGNAIVPQVAQAFIEAYIEATNIIR